MTKKTSLRPIRIFTEEVRKEAVSKIEKGQLNATTASREYGVCLATIYKWLNRYSRILKSSNVIVMAKKDLDKTKESLERELAQVYAELGKKQLQVDFLERLIREASSELGFDLKKNISLDATSGIKNIKDNTRGK